MKLLTINEVCLMYKISRSTVDRWRKDGLPSIKVGRGVRFEENVLTEWVKNYFKQ